VIYLIITETPFRVSFFGGGTDYPEYFTQHGGAVLGTTIDKYAYISASNFYSKLFDYNLRISYRQVECAKNVEEIQHAPFRECLKYCGISKDVEVDYVADLPSFSGLGTSSTFVVGLLNTLYSHQGKYVSPIELAYKAIEVEREILKDSVGCQDQTFAAVGGLNVIEFRKTDDIIVNRISLTPERMKEFEDHLLLVFTGIKRRSGEFAKKQIQNISFNLDRLKRMRKMVDEAQNILTGNGSLIPFGELLHETWCLKSQLDKSMSNDQINVIYKQGIEAGAIGGKLLGAGGGGFILFFVPPEKRKDVAEKLKDYEIVPIKINSTGSHVIHA